MTRPSWRIRGRAPLATGWGRGVSKTRLRPPWTSRAGDEFHVKRILPVLAPASAAPRSSPAIVACDAAVCDGRVPRHSEIAVARDVAKLTAGFVGLLLAVCDDPLQWPARRTLVLRTGPWGCGVFGGDPVAKFFQQVLAAAIAPLVLPKRPTGTTPCVSLAYSTFYKREQRAILRLLMSELMSRKDTEKEVTGGRLLEVLVSVGDGSATMRGAFEPTSPLVSGCPDAQAKYAFLRHAIVALDVSPATVSRLEEQVAAVEGGVVRAGKICAGGCGWDLGSSNPSAYCSRCAALQRQAH